MVVTAVVGVLATGVIHPSVASADPTPSCDATTCTVEFVPAGSVQQWSVPAGVSSVTVAMAGGSGASSAAGGVGGAGGQMMATVPAEWGETFSVVVGTAATNRGGGFGGGGAAGPPRPGPGVGGGGGGGSFVFETFPTTTLLLAVGGGGGAGGDNSEIAGAGGGNGPGSDATTTNADGTVVGLGGTLGAGGSGGAGNQGPSAKGSAGGGPAMAPSNPGNGGNGGVSNLPAMSSGGGGGGGYFGGGGGGVDDPAGINAGAGGGGSGFNDPSTTVVSTSTNTGDGSVTITYPVPATTTTSGVLLDATTGVAIPNSCVVFSPAAFPGRTNYDSVGGDGTWSFTTAESGPFNLAFYTTANGDCSQPILPTPVPSWYINQPLSGTDEHVITPPPGATTVDAGTSGIVACLGATALPTAALRHAAGGPVGARRHHRPGALGQRLRVRRRCQRQRRPSHDRRARQLERLGPAGRLQRRRGLRPVLQWYQGSLQGQRRRRRATRARARSTPARLLRQRLGQPRRSHLSERPLHMGGPTAGPSP